jgi:flagellar assembly protein FliH
MVSFPESLLAWLGWYVSCSGGSKNNKAIEVAFEMKSIGRKVIKAAEVKFFNPSEALSPQPEWVEREKTTEELAKKIQIAEQENYEKGLSEGIRRGRELEKHEALQTLQAMNLIVKELSVLKTKTIEALEEEIVKLSLAIAEKVIHAEATTNREVIQGVLKEAIRNIGDRENMKIRVHPNDFRYMMEIKNDFLKDFDGIRNVVFSEDESLQRGGAIIETTCGEVDARLGQQYSEIKAVMTAST